MLAHQAVATRRWASELDEGITRWAFEGTWRARRQSMHRKGNHQPAIIRGCKRQRAIRGKRRGATNFGAGVIRRAGRSLHRGYATVLVVIMPGVTGVHVRGACRVSASLGEQPNRCGAVVMDRRHLDCPQGLPGQHQEQQHYREITCTHQHECKYNTAVPPPFGIPALTREERTISGSLMMGA